MKIACPKCGFEGDGNFCIKCGAPLPQVEQSMKKPAFKGVLASFLIGVLGAAIGGFFSMFLALWASASDDEPYVIASGIVPGFFICFLGSMWFISMMWDSDDKYIRRVGALFGAGAGALSAFISVIFVDLVICSGCLSGSEDAGVGKSLETGFLSGILPGAFIGLIAALIITNILGMILPKFVKRKPLKPTQSDSGPTEKK